MMGIATRAPLVIIVATMKTMATTVAVTTAAAAGVTMAAATAAAVAKGATVLVTLATKTMKETQNPTQGTCSARVRREIMWLAFM